MTEPKHKRITALAAMDLLEVSYSGYSEGYRLEELRKALRGHVKSYLVRKPRRKKR